MFRDLFLNNIPQYKCHGCSQKTVIKFQSNIGICKKCLLVSRILTKRKNLKIKKTFKSTIKYWQINSKAQIIKRGKKNFYFFKKLLNFVKLNKKDKILDLGSGYGPLLEFTKDNYNMIGLEPNKKNSQISKKMGHNVINKFLEINTFRPKTFKAIVSLFTLTYVTNFSSMLNTLKKILKDDGFILFRVHQYKFSNHIHNPDSFKVKEYDQSTQVSFFSNDSLKNLFNIHNFNIVYFESNINGTTIILKKNKIKVPFVKRGNYKYEIFYLRYLVILISKFIRIFIKIRSEIKNIIFKNN